MRSLEIFLKFGELIPVNAIMQQFSGDYFKKSVV
jgi:hypothetical protein